MVDLTRCRFDFVWYQFGWPGFFFCLPERILPDSFYSSLEAIASFERPEFAEYKVYTDDEGEWVHRVHDIVVANPQPRQPGRRPTRPASTDTRRPLLEASRTPPPPAAAAARPRAGNNNGLATLYEQMFQGFFDGLTGQCAMQ